MSLEIERLKSQILEKETILKQSTNSIKEFINDKIGFVKFLLKLSKILQDDLICIDTFSKRKNTYISTLINANCMIIS